MMNINKYGLYTIKEDYFKRFNSPYLIDNKSERRPYYCALFDNTGILWFIPMSTQVDNYKKKINKDTKKYGDCLFFHLGKIADKTSVFKIGDSIPLTDDYVKAPYTISNIPYIVKKKDLRKELSSKLNKYLALVKSGKLKPHVDILNIAKLLNTDKE